MQQLHAASQPLTLQLSVFNEQHGRTSVVHFSRFPVEIGRSPKNDLVLDHAFVSQSHAAIGFIEERLHVQQVGKSNKLQVDGRALATGEAAPLGTREVILIRPFRITFRAVESGVGAVLDRLEDGSVRRGPGRRHDETRPGEPSSPAPAHADHDLPARPTAPRLVDAATTEASAGLPTVPPSPTAVPLAATAPLPPATAQWASGVDRLLDILLENFVALEQGRHAFRDSIKLPPQEPALGLRLEGPASEQASQLKATLLGGGEPAFERLRVALATQRGHQVGLVDGLMAGVRALLARLSPSALEGQAATEHHLVSVKLLWKLFERAHSDFAEGGHHLFRTIFGSHFKAAYAKLADTDHGQGAG